MYDPQTISLWAKSTLHTIARDVIIDNLAGFESMVGKKRERRVYLHGTVTGPPFNEITSKTYTNKMEVKRATNYSQSRHNITKCKHPRQVKCFREQADER